MNGKRLALALLAAMVFAITLVVYLGMTGGGTGGQSAADSGASAVTSGAGSPLGTNAILPDGGRIVQTIADRKVRDELRRKLLQAWATGDGESAAAAREGRFLPAPAHDGAAMDPEYIQEVIRQDMWPMARACFDELLSRNPHAAGRVEMSFKIVTDEKLGGIVEDPVINADAGAPDSGAITDERMTTCMRESLGTLAFRPPAHGGMVDIVYPIEFSPGDDLDD